MAASGTTTGGGRLHHPVAPTHKYDQCPDNADVDDPKLPVEVHLEPAISLDRPGYSVAHSQLHSAPNVNLAPSMIP